MTLQDVLAYLDDCTDKLAVEGVMKKAERRLALLRKSGPASTTTSDVYTPLEESAGAEVEQRRAFREGRSPGMKIVRKDGG